MTLALILLSVALVFSATLNRVLYSNVARYNRDRERERNAFSAERAELLDRIMHMKGFTWTTPPRPAEEKDDGEPDEETKLLLEGWRQV